MIKNALVSVVPPLLKILGGILITPIILSYLGEESFNLWKVVISLLSMSWILQLGLNSYVNRVIPYNLQLGKLVDTVAVISTVRKFYFLITFLLLIASVIFLLVTDYSSEFRIVFCILLFGYLLFTPFSYERGIMTGYSKFVELAIIDTVTYILYFLLIILITKYTSNKIVFYFVLTLPILLPVFLIKVYICKNNIDLVDKDKCSLFEFKKAIKYSSKSLIFTLSGMLFLNFSVLILYQLIDSSALTSYLLLLQLVGVVTGVSTIMIATIKPEVSKLHAQGNWIKIKEMYYKISIFSIVCGAFFLAYSYFYVGDIIELWVGKSITGIPSVVLLFIIIGQVFWSMLQISYFVSNGIDDHKFISVICTSIFILFFALYFYFQSYFNFANFIITLNCLPIVFYFISTLHLYNKLKREGSNSLVALNLKKVSVILVCLLLAALPSYIDSEYRLSYVLATILINLKLLWLFVLESKSKLIVKEKLWLRKSQL